ncbi:uncharacterized protein LOC117124288 [Anneissia japonica]|uniref:uncharacterized protein LOC117124288 n=1 Tax=Anneissia japonica TaxID=1529436 RepID=UPI0014259AB1|nr:uncharacterized protein LOC117124288 [Anneissia japonica]
MAFRKGNRVQAVDPHSSTWLSARVKLDTNDDSQIPVGRVGYNTSSWVNLHDVRTPKLKRPSLFNKSDFTSLGEPRFLQKGDAVDNLLPNGKRKPSGVVVRNDPLLGEAATGIMLVDGDLDDDHDDDELDLLAYPIVPDDNDRHDRMEALHIETNKVLSTCLWPRNDAETEWRQKMDHRMRKLEKANAKIMKKNAELVTLLDSNSREIARLHQRLNTIECAPVQPIVAMETGVADIAPPEESGFESSIPEHIRIKIVRFSENRLKVARLLVQHLFTVEERLSSNISGKMGAHRLDPVRMEIVKRETFNISPSPAGKRERHWRACQKSIDAARRHMKARMKSS